MTSKISNKMYCLLAGGLIGGLFLTPVPAGVALDRIIAVVNDDVVMQSELAERVRTIKGQLREQGTSLPPTLVLEKQVLDRLILTKLQIQTAQNTGIRVDDESLNRTISNIAAENRLSLAQFRDILESDGYSYEKFREDIRNEILISRLQQRQVDNRISISEQEIENHLETQEHQGNLEIEYKISHLLFVLPGDPTADDLAGVRQKAEGVLEELAAGADFAELSALYSDAQAVRGGDLGWRKSPQIPTLFADFIADMEAGDVSELIKSPSGYHIIRLDDIRSSEKHVINQTHVRHIFLRPDELTDEEDIKLRLEQLKIRIDGGDDFAELARGHSNDTVSAAEGGDLGWISPGALGADIDEAIATLAVGEVSAPVKSRLGGWHIIQVLGRREHDSTEDVKRARAREAIRQRKIQEARENWLRQMRDDAYVEYRLDS